MAVYTEVGEDDLAQFLADYDLGEMMSFKGIAEGVENTNYVLHTKRGYFILTLYEKRAKKEDLPFFIGLMEHLAARGINCPQPVKNK
jgi:homoserine kinase type II